MAPPSAYSWPRLFSSLASCSATSLASARWLASSCIGCVLTQKLPRRFGPRRGLCRRQARFQPTVIKHRGSAANGLEHLASFAVSQPAEALDFQLVLLALGGDHACDGRREWHCVYSAGLVDCFEQLYIARG